MYAEAIFDELGFGAVTINPYLGREAIQPFLDRKDKAAFVLVKTSNPGSAEFQDLPVGNEKLYERVARAVAEGWNQNWNCGVVVGATYPAELAGVRAIIGDLPILVPGVGAQGGDPHQAYEAGKNKKGAGSPYRRGPLHHLCILGTGLRRGGAVGNGEAFKRDPGRLAHPAFTGIKYGDGRPW